MNDCFVIQPFDNDKFDKRFVDVFSPAIEKAGLVAYRVDKDEAANDLVIGIKEGIEKCSAFLADLTLDNPNVWFELGYALAARKPFCLICSDERTSGRYPFDVSQLKIIQYKTGSTSDFADLESKITSRLKAVSAQDSKLEALSESVAALPTQGGLDTFEQVALSIVFEEHLENGVSPFSFKQQMERAGFTKTAAVLALVKLERKGLIITTQEYDSDRDISYKTIQMAAEGLVWVEENQEKLILRTEISDSDIPF